MIHVNFHSYHTKLKYLGAQIRASHEDFPECSENTQSQNVIPEITEEFVCHWEHCDMTINNPEWFYQHVNMHAFCAEKQSLSESKKAILCRWKDCEGICRSRHKLREHLRTHTQEKVVACPSCGGMFSNNTKFFDHAKRQISEDQQVFVCQYCNKHFASERLLRDHVRVHVSHVKCALCGLTCCNLSSLKVHIRFRHSNERPFPCDFCDSSFKNTYDLRKHIETHNDSSAYCCEVNRCDFSSRTLQTFRQHYRRVHESNGTIKYKCHICQKCFSWSYSLTLHLRKIHQLSGHSRFRYKEDDDGYWSLNVTNYQLNLGLSQGLENHKLAKKASVGENNTSSLLESSAPCQERISSMGLHSSTFSLLSEAPAKNPAPEVETSLRESVYCELQNDPMALEKSSCFTECDETMTLGAKEKIEEMIQVFTFEMAL
ncbi:histone H4 transcription factor-like isoform X2 [Ornithorhynchus anatinus]|nr:histone H4 transcription factor-like isoform X2 [Ornithorhynchus anatinus]XP_028938991.1 histone H4 transcription factor-like isoform X2 [Ornithorhynchus anatinus]